jgi:hypothetical protein
LQSPIESTSARVSDTARLWLRSELGDKDRIGEGLVAHACSKSLVQQRRRNKDRSRPPRPTARSRSRSPGSRTSSRLARPLLRRRTRRDDPHHPAGRRRRRARAKARAARTFQQAAAGCWSMPPMCRPAWRTTSRRVGASTDSGRWPSPSRRRGRCPTPASLAPRASQASTRPRSRPC